MNLKQTVRIGGINLRDIILCLVNAVMIFGILLFVSIFLSSGDECWSLYSFNMEEMSPFNIEISWIKVFIMGFISLVISFFLIRMTSEKKI